MQFFKSPIGKTFTWLLGNWVFGVGPLLLMILIRAVSSNQDANKEVHHLINDGLPLFVACAIMGSVVMDYILDDQKRTTIEGFLLTGLPIGAFVLLLLMYMLIIFKVLPEEYFSSNAWLYWFEVGFSFFYCSLAKYYFFKHTA